MMVIKMLIGKGNLKKNQLSILNISRDNHIFLILFSNIWMEISNYRVGLLLKHITYHAVKSVGHSGISLRPRIVVPD